MADDLATFIRARLDEDEQVAQAVIDRDRERFPDGSAEDAGSWADAGLVVDLFSPDGSEPTQAAHIARWDPARVLAEVQAKRELIEEIQGLEDRIDGEWGDGRGYGDHETALRWFALPYGGHPDFDSSWRPSPV